jgi:SAM-dependent methyltransferase
VKPGYWDFQREVEDWHFWFRTRRRILELLLERHGVPADARLLDVGCGAGGNSLALSRFGRVVALDREPAALEACRARPYAWRVQGTAERLPFADGSFDVVAALDVLEHLDDDRAGAAELTRVLRPGGLLVAFVPAFQSLWGYNDDSSEHRRRYARGELEATLRSAALDIEYTSYINVALTPFVFVARRLATLLGVKARYEHGTDPRGHALLGAAFSAEVPLLARGVRFPIGVSLAALARKAR